MDEASKPRSELGPLAEDPGLWRAVFERSRDAVFLVDPGADQIVDCNPRAGEMLGYTREELIALPMSAVHPDEMPLVRTFSESVFAEGAGWTTDLTCATKDGRTLQVEISASVAEVSGRRLMIALVRDVSEFEREQRRSRDLQGLLDQQRALLEINRAISAHLDREGLFRAVGEAIGRIAGFDRMGVVLPDPSTDELMLYALEGAAATPDHHAGDRYPPEGTVQQWVLEHGRSFVVESLDDLADFPGTRASLEADGMRSALAYPLKVGARTLGVLYFRWAAEDGVQAVAMGTLEETASAVAVALDNTLAYEEITRLKERLSAENTYLREELRSEFHHERIVGDSPALHRVLDQIDAVARTNASVLILGESGVGKELVARAIHERSLRAEYPLVKVNCASIPKDLFESEFFGHVKGAFTGALKDRVGRFQLADGGTLFLDEVGEIPLELQGKLLRVLQEREFERVGDDTTRQVDVRIIAASNRDLKREVEAGRFRQDLFYRLGVFPVEVPPLRERREDVEPLARHFLRLAATELKIEEPMLTAAQAERLRAYDWPGNVRELQNVMERAAILRPGGSIPLELVLPEVATTAAPAPEEAAEERPLLTSEQLKELERANIVAALERAGGKISGPGGAAELLGIKPSTLSYQMKSLGIARPR